MGEWIHVELFLHFLVGVGVKVFYGGREKAPGVRGDPPFTAFDTILFLSVEDKYPLVMNKKGNFALRFSLPLVFSAQAFLSSK